jgi:phosphoglycerate dehydrogenase-like enzyme
LLTYGVSMADHVLSEATHLRWIHALTTGTDGIDNLPSLRPEVLLTSTRGIHGTPVSEAALMAMLALNRDFPRAIRNQDRGV